MENKIFKIKKNHFTSNIPEVKIIKRKDGSTYTVRPYRIRYFFPDEWMAFYDSLKPRQRLTFNFLINTGARINEIRHIQVGDVDFERNSIVLKETKSRNPDGSRRMRVITISPQFVKSLKKSISELGLKQDDYFPILTISAANIAMKNVLKRIGVPDFKMFSVHNVRKTLETWLLALDIDSLKIAKHFGHSLAVAGRFYVSGDTFSYEDKQQMRMIIGGLMSRYE